MTEPEQQITEQQNTDQPAQNSKKKGVVRRLYDWVLSWANTPYGSPALFLLSFIESSFFPIPPDVLQIALSAGKPRRSFYYAAISLAGSLLGAILGYFIGMFLWDATKDIFIPHLFSQENFATVAGDDAAGIVREDTPEGQAEVKIGWYQTYGFWAVFAAAVTPIPYKIFTIAAGVCSLPLPLLLFASFLGRGARFFAVATLMFAFGEKIERWIDKYFNLLSILFTVLLIGGFCLIKFVF